MLQKSHNSEFCILIIEDSEINSTYLKLVISKFLPNASIIEADSGENAIEILKKAKPDLIFLNYYLEDKNGNEVVSYIRNTSYLTQTPVVLLSSIKKTEEKIALSKLGLKDYLQKPSRPDIIVNILRKYLLNENDAITNESQYITGSSKEHFNKTQLTQKVGDDSAFLKLIFDSFFNNFITHINRVRISIKENDKDLFINIVHHLKGEAATLCLEILNDLLCKLEVTDLKCNKINNILELVENEYEYLKKEEVTR